MDDTARENRIRKWVSLEDPTYRRAAEREAEFWERTDFAAAIVDYGEVAQRFLNGVYTGNPDTTWLDDVIARGPYRSAAVLGCNEGAFERTWLRANASARLDVYDLSPRVLRKVRARLSRRRFGLSWPDRRVRFIPVDLNFARLPRQRYDAVWTSGCIHHVTNLEDLCTEIARSLRDGGLFALHDYVGERRLRYDGERLRLANAVLAEIPPRFRRGGIEVIAPPGPDELSPFCGVRSDEILAVARRYFDVVHLAFGNALFPLQLVLDLPAMEREAPELIERVLAAEVAASRRPDIRPCAAYAVFRRRATSEPNASA